jgi:addiction module HigA family antidote
MTQTALAEQMGVHVQVVNGIVQGRRAVTAKTALLLANALDTTPQFWLNLQNACDLWEAQQELPAPKRLTSGVAFSRSKGAPTRERYGRYESVENDEA